MEKPKVSLVRFMNDRNNVRRAIELCGGFDRLNPSDHVLLKPNLVMWDNVYPFPGYGVVTTAVVVEEVVSLLKEAGASRITIGESTIEDSETGSTTRAAFAGLGYQRLCQKFGVKLVDFNDGPFTSVDFGGFCLEVAVPALETDFLINLPVLKTHNSTRVSLGFKNLKGCLNLKSKIHCHHREMPLDYFVARLGEKIPVGLTLIDGIYAIEKGPAVNGKAYRTDVLAASTDLFAADVVGSALLGFNAADILHLREYAKRHNRSLGLQDIEVLGGSIAELAKPLEWDWKWLADDSGPEAFRRLGIKGLHYPKYDQTICSGCSYLNNFLLITLLGAYHGEPFGGYEFLGGKVQRSAGGHNKTFLFGSCSVRVNRNNPHINEQVNIRGCPPTTREIIKVLNKHGIPADYSAYRAYRESLAERYRGKPEFDSTHFAVSD